MSLMICAMGLSQEVAAKQVSVGLEHSKPRGQEAEQDSMAWIQVLPQ